jgi:hypothetical protein
MLEPTQRKFTPEEHAHLVQMQARQAGRDLDARVAASEIALRQWCVEQAVKASGDSGALMSVEQGEGAALGASIVRFATVDLASHILDFVTAPLKPEQTNG